MYLFYRRKDSVGRDLTFVTRANKKKKKSLSYYAFFVAFAFHYCENSTTIRVIRREERTAEKEAQEEGRTNRAREKKLMRRIKKKEKINELLQMRAGRLDVTFVKPKYVYILFLVRFFRITSTTTRTTQPKKAKLCLTE